MSHNVTRAAEHGRRPAELPDQSSMGVAVVWLAFYVFCAVWVLLLPAPADAPTLSQSASLSSAE